MGHYSQNKKRTGTLQVPASAKLAAATAARQTEEAVEREQLKRLVLAANQKQVCLGSRWRSRESYAPAGR